MEKQKYTYEYEKICDEYKNSNYNPLYIDNFIKAQKIKDLNRISNPLLTVTALLGGLFSGVQLMQWRVMSTKGRIHTSIGATICFGILAFQAKWNLNKNKRLSDN